MSLFETIPLAPPDPILGLTETFKADERAEKVNLGVGVFVDEKGRTPVLACVANAERRLAEASAPKAYLPILGTPGFQALTQQLCFAQSRPAHLVTAQTPGGTGGLRVAADLLARSFPKASVWLSRPTWVNHQGVFAAAGFGLQHYPYFDASLHGVGREAFFAALRAVPAGDIVLLHACCHNPTGADLTLEDWAQVATIAAEGGWLPFVDFAYQGFGDGLGEDAAGVRLLAEAGLSMVVAQSFSKNFGLYQDRVGALHFVCASAEERNRLASQLKVAIRVNYSNPPAHGGAIVAMILEDTLLAAQWETEVAAMRDRINGVRRDFVAALARAGVSRDFGFLTRQRGMFSFTGITAEQVEQLREEHAVYIVGSGRINVAGLTPGNLPHVVSAIKAVLG
ncbi:MAG: aromatic amino acid transaminase [Opitutales bacterium]